MYCIKYINKKQWTKQLQMLKLVKHIYNMTHVHPQSSSSSSVSGETGVDSSVSPSASSKDGIGAALLQVWPVHFVHRAEQCTPIFLQPHDTPQPSALQPQEIMLSRVSGAMGRSVSTGVRMSCSFHPHAVGCKGLPIHSWIVRYVLKECCLAAALVGGKVANWNVEESDVLLIALL